MASVSGYAEGSDWAIAIEDLVVAYGRQRALDGLSLRVPVGFVFGFLGPNGAGKTTTIKTLLGFRPPDAGSARVLGHDSVRDSLEIRARVGYVSEVHTLYDQLTIPRMCALARSISRRWDQAVVDRYLKLFGLPPQAKIGKLSKGKKTQLALSLVMGSQAELLILDEPTTGLDPVARHQFLQYLVSEVAAAGKTVFFSSHILSEVETVADWIGIIKDGRTLANAELDDLRRTHRVLKLSYAEPVSAEEVAALRALPGVMRLEQEGRSARLVVRGDAETLARQIEGRSVGLRALDALPMNLETIFLEYMGVHGGEPR